MKHFPGTADPNLLVGFESSDDAAVYRLTDALALVSTVDFITPPVDDPVWFGRIAAANSLSDVYAMGGRPLTALNLIMFPAKKLGTSLLQEILAGGYEKVTEAGACLAGGHSVEDEEPKYGLAVTGVVSPDRVLRNTGARVGDVLVLTKPLGTGVLFNACRSGKLPWPDLEAILPEVAALNRDALTTALQTPVNACTDITGFGILGHCLEMAKGSGLRIRLHFDALPLYPHALEMYRRRVTTGSNQANERLVQDHLVFARPLDGAQMGILLDPQTSGGLLLSLPATEADTLVGRLRTTGVHSARIIGETIQGGPGIEVV